MTDVADQRNLVDCPKCRQEIPAGAIVCPVCRSDIRVRSASERRRERIAGMARFIKEWIGFPAAVITALVALAGPAAVNILWLLGQDHARLSFEKLRLDVLNVGLDDTPIASQGERVDITIPFWRAALVNNGASPATVRSEFICSRKDEAGALVGGRFYFFDLATQRKLLDDVEVAAGGTVFVNVVLSESGLAKDGYAVPETLGTCEFRYSDKYREYRPLVVADEPGGGGLMAMGGPDDRRVAAREAYCSGMVRGIGLGGEPVDCVSATHLLAIETVTLWERALGRAMRQVAEFRRTNPGSDRKAGIVLETCDRENCAQEEARLALALGDFSPGISVWLCPKREFGSTATVNLAECAGTDYPTDNRPVDGPE